MDRQPMYSADFYAAYTSSSEASAEAIVPEVIRLTHPSSVIDVGCGEGVWLSVFSKHGVTRVVGMDGEYVRRDRLRIPREQFLPRDLSQAVAPPEQFSLVVSLEVAEHLPPSAAETFVRSLVGLGKTVLFSAAVPFQGGTHHVNLQWQDYWAGLFGSHGFVAVDAIRPLIWQNQSVSFWYRQNVLLFVEQAHLQTQPALMDIHERSRHLPLSVAHPQFVACLGQGVSDTQLDSLYLGQVLPRLPRMVSRAVARRLGWAPVNGKH